MSEPDLRALLSTLRGSADLGLDPDGQSRIELAVDLRVAVGREGPPNPFRRAVSARRRGRMLGTAAIGAAAAAAVVLVTLPSAPPTAQASTPLIETAPSAVPSGPREALREELGSAADLDRAWGTPAFGGTAYLVRRENAWCLSAPDPLTARPDVERGSTCTDAATFDRFGISLTIGANYIAVLPEGVRDPTVEHRRTTGSIRPSAHGVVVLERLRDPTTITRYDAAGRRRRDTVRSIETRTVTCPDGVERILGPDQPCP